MQVGAELAAVSDEDLASSPAAVRALLVSMAARITALEARVIELERENVALRAENALLREKLGLNSSNSGKPPSSDGPGVTPPPSKPSKKKRGGQPKHPRHRRDLIPVEKVDQVLDLHPSHCNRCGETLAGDDPEPLRHQVVELAEVLRRVDEYRLHRLTCPCCDASTLARLPEGVPTGAFGPRLIALVSLLSGRYRISKRAVTEMLREVFEVEMSTGAVCNSERVVSEALEDTVAEARTHVQSQPVVHVDETSWREARKRAWLWVMATLSVTCFRIDRHRSTKAAQELMGANFKGLAVSDRYVAYAWLPDDQRQSCWAHLDRDWQRMIDRGSESAAIGGELRSATESLFRWWHRVRDGTRDRAWLREKVRRLRRTVHDALERGRTGTHAKTAGTCNEILLVEDTLWTFVAVEGVEPTNNFAERQIRHGVMWRKTSFGTDSEAGSRFVERILTVVMSLRSQGRRILDFLVQSLRAVAGDAERPSLLPAVALAHATPP
jgi:transposase